MDLRSVHMKVHGRVQGVGFRFQTKSEAKRSNIKGWVRNNPDGTVEIDAEGENDKIEGFVAAVKEGPGAAKVTELDLEETSENKNYTSFEIK